MCFCRAEKEDVMRQTPAMIATVIFAVLTLLMGIANAVPSIPIPPP
jgi:hypothetical protein